jgi:hypothetical protein
VNGEVDMPMWGRGPLVGRPGLWGFADGPLAAAANAIGIEPAELLAEVADGATIGDVAQEHGVDADGVVAAIVDSMRERLDAAVDNGWITREQADERVAELEELATSIVNGDVGPFPFPHPGRGDGSFMHGDGPFGPGWAREADATTTETSLF